MANTTSAKKATRKIARRTAVNKSRRTKMRGSVRLVEEAITKGDREAAVKAFAAAEPELMKAAQRNIIHRNAASRKVSRLSHRIAALVAIVLALAFAWVPYNLGLMIAALGGMMAGARAELKLGLTP